MSNKIQLLYVDDEPINLKIFELTFSSKFKVKTALSGFEGMTILENNPEIKVVVSDMRMPKMDGLEFIRKSKELYPNIIFFILTGYEITDEISDALDNNLINKYFKKPFNIKEIESSVENAMAAL